LAVISVSKILGPHPFLGHTILKARRARGVIPPWPMLSYGNTILTTAVHTMHYALTTRNFILRRKFTDCTRDYGGSGRGLLRPKMQFKVLKYMMKYMHLGSQVPVLVDHQSSIIMCCL
jgi:hypothetical protein